MRKFFLILIYSIITNGCSFDKSSTIWEYNSEVVKIDYNLNRESSYEKYKENLINYSNNSEFPDINKIDE